MNSAFTPRDLAARWKCSVGHIRGMIRRGDLPAFRIGDKFWRISTAVVEDAERWPHPHVSGSLYTADFTMPPGKSAVESGARHCGPVIVRLPKGR